MQIPLYIILRTSGRKGTYFQQQQAYACISWGLMHTWAVIRHTLWLASLSYRKLKTKLLHTLTMAYPLARAWNIWSMLKNIDWQLHSSTTCSKYNLCSRAKWITVASKHGLCSYPTVRPVYFWIWTIYCGPTRRGSCPSYFAPRRHVLDSTGAMKPHRRAFAGSNAAATCLPSSFSTLNVPAAFACANTPHLYNGCDSSLNPKVVSCAMFGLWGFLPE